MARIIFPTFFILILLATFAVFADEPPSLAYVIEETSYPDPIGDIADDLVLPLYSETC